MRRIVTCLCAGLLGLAMACAGGGAGGTDPGVPADVPADVPVDVPADVPVDVPADVPVDVPVAGPDYGDVHVPPADQEFLAKHLGKLAEARDMTTDDLFARHYAERPYLQTLGWDPLQADGLDLVQQAYALTGGERGMLQGQAFVATPRISWESPPLGYQDLWQRDLPVLVTTDSILFAVHKSYDRLLKEVELSALAGVLGDILQAAHGQVATAYAGMAVDADALADVDLFYTVARSLLSGTAVAPVQAANAAKRDALLAQVEKLEPELIDLFGRPYPCAAPGCAYDFSQFKPRGHYAEDPILQRYFKAMIWLGRTELALTRYPRELAASALMLDTVTRAGKLPAWRSFDRAIQAFVGQSDNLTMEGLTSFLADQAADVAAASDPARAKALMDALETGGYAQQRIMSQIMATDPFSSTPTALPPIFLFLGQRYVIDSHVLSDVVYDRITWQGGKPERYMPSPLDPMFVLGFQEALPLLRDELDAWHYAGNLHVLRWLVDSHDASFWAASMYNVWLDALRALSVDTTDAAFPDAMRTRSYARKAMHTALASWAELRHDTILYVKQSYTGVSCDYPDAYVEPYKAFYDRIAAFAGTSATLFKGLDLGFNEWWTKQVTDYFDNLRDVATTLSAIAAVELAGQPRTPEQTAFLRSLVNEDSMCGDTPFTGWYADLFWDNNDTTFQFDPTVADVHTDPNSTDVLHVATGRADLAVMAVKTSCGVKAYAGPVSSYYEFREPGYGRLTDAEWKARLGALGDGPRPAWVSDFLKAP